MGREVGDLGPPDEPVTPQINTMFITQFTLCISLLLDEESHSRASSFTPFLCWNQRHVESHHVATTGG